MNSIKKCVAVILFLLMLLPVFTVNAEETTGYDKKLSDMAQGMKACIAYDVTNDKTIFQKNSDMKISIASTTKIITSLVALKYAEAEEIFTVGSELMIVQPNSSLCLIQKGHQLKLKTLIAGMLLPSGNDAAYTVAVNIARKHSGNTEMTDTEAKDYFCGLMNDYAKSLGCTSTHFSNPDGWDDPSHYSTAGDMLIFAKEALKNEALIPIMSTFSRTFFFASGENIQWKSSNALLDPASPYYYPFANGMKTGTTEDAGNCLIASAKKSGVQMIILAFDCDADYIYSGKEIRESVFTDEKELTASADIKAETTTSEEAAAEEASTAEATTAEVTTEEASTAETTTAEVTTEEASTAERATAENNAAKAVSQVSEEEPSSEDASEEDKQENPETPSDDDIKDSKLTDNDIRFGKVKEMFEFIFNAPVKGDVDISGNITAADARFTLRASIGLEECTDTVLMRGDIDGNGRLSASDARFILRASVGLETIR